MGRGSFRCPEIWIFFLNFHLFREAFKIFDRDKDGYISMKELKKVTSMLGTVLTKEEIEEFMAEADVVRVEAYQDNLAAIFFSGWKWQTGL